MLNGVPWWYPAAQPAPLAGRSLASVDPDGALKAAIPAERLGVRFAMTIPERIDNTAALGDFKTSMLQDYEAGRRLELDAIVGAVIELAEIVDVPVPTLRTVRALVDLRARVAPMAR